MLPHNNLSLSAILLYALSQRAQGRTFVSSWGSDWLNDKDVLRGLRNPNATGSITIPGRDLAAEYPGTEVDWQLRINVSASIPASYLESKKVDDYYTVAGIYLSPPEWPYSQPENGTKVLDVDKSWRVCASYIEPMDDAQEASINDEGDCHATLGEECVKAILNYTEISGGDDCSWRSEEVDKVCEGKWRGGSSRAIISNGSIYLNPSYYLTGMVLPFSPRQDDEIHKKGNTTIYETEAKKAWPVLISFHADASNFNIGDTVRTDPFKKASLTCIRADTVIAGSMGLDLKPLKDDEGDGSVRQLPSVGLVALALSLGVALLL